MTYFSKRTKATATVLTVILFITAGICACLARLDFGYNGLFWVLTMAALVAMIQIAQRYLLAGYEYFLDPEEDLFRHNRLTVIRIVGNRRTSLFTTPLASLTRVIPYRKNRKVQAEFGKVSARMDFSADLFPAESYLLFFEIYGELTTVRLQCDAAFAEELTRRAGI